jgi:hypothetical protein
MEKAMTDACVVMGPLASAIKRFAFDLDKNIFADFCHWRSLG